MRRTATREGEREATDARHGALGDRTGCIICDVAGHMALALQITMFCRLESIYVHMTCLSSGRSRSARESHGVVPEYWAPQNQYLRLLGDVNGDGKDDVVALNPG
jgi:hypothetical protein